jgi:hypothetical protein
MCVVIMTRITYSDKCTSGDGVRVLDVFMEPVSSSVGTNADL